MTDFFRDVSEEPDTDIFKVVFVQETVGNRFFRNVYIFYQTTRRHTPKDGILHCHRSENFQMSQEHLFHLNDIFQTMMSVAMYDV